MKVFIDSNIPMYVAGADHPNKAPARRFLEAVRAGEVEGCTSTEVLQEILYRYCALQRRDLADRVYRLFVQVVPVIFDVTLADTDQALELLGSVESLSARDAVHAGVMLNREVGLVASFDRGFDLVEGIERIALT